VTKSGSGSGTVASSPVGINCGATCSASFAVGSQVTLTATPASGSVFSGWSGAGCSGTGSCLVTMNAAQAVNASFTQLYTLTVTKAGSGSGTVTSSPAGINCGATCSASFASGTSVTLTATPASGSVFGSWSGAGCSGTGSCVVTMNAAQSVTATFLPNPSQAQTVSFIARGDFAVGTNPKSVAVSDFNGDGRLDLAVTNASSYDVPGTVSVLLGNGDGTFQPVQSFAAGNDAYSVAVGDVNGDGRPDLAVANAGSNTVSVLLGNGVRTFQPAPSFAAGSGVFCLAVGDVNGGERPDLVVANAGGSSGVPGTVSVLLGNGDGTFQPARTFNTGVIGLNYSVAAGDVNGDRKLDLAVANQYDNTVSLLLGKGDSAFQRARSFAEGNG